MNNCWYRPDQSTVRVCRNGHLMTSNNLYVRPKRPNQQPSCLACKKDQNKRSYERVVEMRGGVKNPRMPARAPEPKVTTYKMSDMEAKQAACLFEDPELFAYPSKADKDITTLDIAPAVAICQTCPVLEMCLREGMENEDWSVRGGQLLRAGKVMYPGKPKPERRSHHKAAGATTATDPLDRYLGRLAGTTCKNGHPVTKETVQEYSGRPGWFHCAVCKQETHGMKLSLDGMWKKCLSGEHYMVPTPW
jgi:hypothetical protein